ncbi:MAG: hypothetical protein QNJ57_12250 [Flavobacteriaceae bacterium]|nr:hypothetical protein [Flavobacteriaceae bacterium]
MAIALEEKLLTYLDLASEHIGGEVTFATDDTFGNKENLIKQALRTPISVKTPTKSIKIDGWMPKAAAEHHWAGLQLGAEGIIKGFAVDTRNLNEHGATRIGIDALSLDGRVEDWQLADFLDWDEILSETYLTPNKVHFFEINSEKPYTHVRLHVYGQGGIARLKVFGEAYRDWSKLSESHEIDLVLATNGGKALACSNTDIGSIDNLIVPRKSIDHKDGWFTKKTESEKAGEWVIFKMAHKGFIEKIIVDTYNFWEDRPESCTLEYCISDNDEGVINSKIKWRELLSRKGLKPHRENPFLANVIPDHEAITHVRLKIYPFGGISRLRLIGTIKK